MKTGGRVMAKRVSKDDFDKEVLQSELPVIVDFYSDSCIPCKQLSPILGDIEDDYEDKAKVVKKDLKTYEGDCYLGIDAGSTTTKLVLIDNV